MTKRKSVTVAAPIHRRMAIAARMADLKIQEWIDRTIDRALAKEEGRKR